MKTFGLFLTESSRKNLHIEHLEDEVFNRGISGAMSSISFLKSFNSLLEGTIDSSVRASVKWDGSPAIVCGRHPETGKFFLGTKSVFNICTPKINYCEQDIYKNHGDKPKLAERLCVAFKELQKLPITEVVQGDLLFVEHDLITTSHNGQTNVTFKPNTITYSIPINSSLGESISSAKVGVAFHTTYKGSCMKTLIPTYETNVVSNTPSVIVFESTIKPKETLKTEQVNAISPGILNLIELFDKLDEQFLKTISNTPAIQRTIKRYVNSKVALGEGVCATQPYIDGFYQFLENSHKKFLGYFLEHRKELTKVFLFVEQINFVKRALLNNIYHTDSINMFIESSAGFKSTSIEGIVLSDNFGNVVKLVDRLEFSHNNFKHRGLV